MTVPPDWGTVPDQGTVTIGSNVRMGYFAQHSMDLLDGDDTVFESLDGSFPQAGLTQIRKNEQVIIKRRNEPHVIYVLRNCKLIQQNPAHSFISSRFA